MTLKELLFGKAINPFRSNLFKRMSLVAFFAWIGLGADGLSSSCYGPSESFIALGEHTDLALFIALGIILTVFVISLSYNQVCELFPSGGGGYKVASKLLGSHAGVVSGCALIIDYVLTIAISTASAVDALFSFFPATFQPYKLSVEFILIMLLVFLNLRGMKESIGLLLPIFVGFMITHAILIIYGIIAHENEFGLVVNQAVATVHATSSSMGLIGLLGITLFAYSMGSGTYTGLEAVSNNVNRLAEPRTHTARMTMLYMAVSLSFTAGGITLLYLMWHVNPNATQTLNAIVFHDILGDSNFGTIALIVTLCFEAGILLVAANTGFIAGPAVLANMAIDSWLPRRFHLLSQRLVTKNGILLYGVLALLILALSEGRVEWLVVLYSINVFITFSLTLLGLCRYWITHGKIKHPNWTSKLILALMGFIVTTVILFITIIEKFTQGGWVTLVITGLLIILCLLIKSHYNKVRIVLNQVTALLAQPFNNPPKESLSLNPNERTAIVFVDNERGVTIHTLLWIQRMFPGYFKNIVFLHVGTVDTQSFSGEKELQKMREKSEASLAYYIRFCNEHHIAAKAYAEYGTDTVEILMTLSESARIEFKNHIFFATQLSFKKDNWYRRLLHNGLPYVLQRRLHTLGEQLVILPMRIE